MVEILVFQDSRVAWLTRPCLDPNKTLVVTYMDAVAGFRFDHIRIQRPTQDWLEASRLRTNTFFHWINLDLRNRMVAGATIEWFDAV